MARVSVAVLSAVSALACSDPPAGVERSQEAFPPEDLDDAPQSSSPDTRSASGGYRVTAVTRLSGLTPFRDGCAGSRFDDGRVSGYELETMIATDPARPHRIVATWKQDTGTAGARSDLIASSRDDGSSWSIAQVPGLSVCTGGGDTRFGRWAR